MLPILEETAFALTYEALTVHSTASIFNDIPFVKGFYLK